MPNLKQKIRALLPGFRPGAVFFVLLCAVILLPSPPVSAASSVVQKKKSLEEITLQLDEKKQELERYRVEEERISRELSGLKKEARRTDARRRELEEQLRKAKSRSGETLQKYDSLEKTRKGITGDIYGEVVMLSLQKDFYYPYFGMRDITKDMLLRSAMFKKSALLSSIKGESVRVHKDIQTLKRKGAELQSRQALMVRQGHVRKTVLRAKQTELDKTRKKQALLARELKELQDAALGLTRLVKKLQKRAPYRSSDFDTDLPIERNSMTPPAEGRVISDFGRETVPGLKTWIVREGIRIATRPEAPVHAALAGKVIYAGPFRAYGNVVIVDHEKGFFTIYGLLSRIDAGKGDNVTPASQLGLAGEDTQAMSTGKKASGSAVYFEIRKGDRALNPAKWLNLP